MTRVGSGPTPTAPPSNSSTSGGSAAPSSPSAGSPYSVQSGDTLYAIAQQAYGDGSRDRCLANSSGPGDDHSGGLACHANDLQISASRAETSAGVWKPKRNGSR